MNIDRETFRKILAEDLDMWKLCAKMVPKELTEEEKQRRVTICQGLLERQDDILGRLITGDETLVYQYDPETKRQIVQWKTANYPRPKKYVGPNQESKQCCCLFYIRGIVHYEFVPSGQTVNRVHYLEVLERLSEKVRRKRAELSANNSWILNHDNAPAHTALYVSRQCTCSHATVCITTMHLLTRHCLYHDNAPAHTALSASRQCTCSHGTVCEGVFIY